MNPAQPCLNPSAGLICLLASMIELTLAWGSEAQPCLNPSAGLICLLAMLSLIAGADNPDPRMFKSLGWVDMPSGLRGAKDRVRETRFKSLGWVDMPSGTDAAAIGA